VRLEAGALVGGEVLDGVLHGVLQASARPGGDRAACGAAVRSA
jgi:hypothetical protein